MSRAVLNLTIDAVAAALLTAMVGTGYVLWFALPPGTNRTHILWGLQRHEWGAVHFGLSATLLAVLAVHVALHWRWLVIGLSKRVGLAASAERSPRRAGLILLAAVGVPLTVLAVGAQVSVRPMDRPRHPLPDEPRADAERAASAVVARAEAVLAERCASCHRAGQPAAGLRADTTAALREAQAGGRWIVPGRPDESRLLEVVGVPSPTRPIASRHRLARSEVDALRAWIASLSD